MSQTPNLGLPYLAPSQAQKHVTHNEALRRLDALVQLAVEDRTHAAPPPEPAEGANYLVASPATGVFEGHETEVAAFQDGAWAFILPGQGWCAWVQDEATLVAFSGTEWTPVSHPGAVRHAQVGVNTDADATNRLAVKADSILLSHDDVTPGSGDMRAVLNKAAPGSAAGLLFQTGYSGRAEIALAGDDMVRLKVSADGTNWLTALSADPSTGQVGIGTDAPGAQLTVASGSEAYPTALKIEETQHASSARAAAWIGDWLLGQDAWGTGTKDFFIYNAASGATFGSVGTGGGLVWGTPSGGDKGMGTVNAVAVYDDNALLSCYVFDQALDGAVDAAKWDARVPVRTASPGVTGKGGKPVSAGQETHIPLRHFLSRIGSAHDPLTLDGYARHWKEKRHLSSLPNEAGFDPDKGLPTGAWIQRLVETVEIQAVLIEALNARMKAVEGAGQES